MIYKALPHPTNCTPTPVHGAPATLLSCHSSNPLDMLPPQGLCTEWGGKSFPDGGNMFMACSLTSFRSFRNYHLNGTFSVHPAEISVTCLFRIYVFSSALSDTWSIMYFTYLPCSLSVFPTRKHFCCFVHGCLPCLEQNLEFSVGIQ